MLYLKMVDATHSGKHRNTWRTYEDKDTRVLKPHQVCQFIFDSSVRDMLIVKDHLERLDAFPFFYEDGEDVTTEFLSSFLEEMDKVFGLDVTDRCGKMETAVREYYKEKGVDM